MAASRCLALVASFALATAVETDVPMGVNPNSRFEKAMFNDYQYGPASRQAGGRGGPRAPPAQAPGSHGLHHNLPGMHPFSDHYGSSPPGTSAYHGARQGGGQGAPPQMRFQSGRGNRGGPQGGMPQRRPQVDWGTRGHQQQWQAQQDARAHRARPRTRAQERGQEEERFEAIGARMDERMYEPDPEAKQEADAEANEAAVAAAQQKAEAGQPNPEEMALKMKGALPKAATGKPKATLSKAQMRAAEQELASVFSGVLGSVLANVLTQNPKMVRKSMARRKGL